MAIYKLLVVDYEGNEWLFHPNDWEGAQECFDELLILGDEPELYRLEVSPHVVACKP
jgi:hypothetical protein